MTNFQQFISKHRYTIYLVFIICIGAFFRFFNISDKSYWVDECNSAVIASYSASEIMNIAVNDLHPPLYYLLLHFWINLFSNTEFWGRSLSAIFSIILIPASYVLIKHLFTKRIAAITVFLMALSPFLIEYAQESRNYTLLALLSVLSFIFYLRLLSNSFSIWNIILYILFTTCLLYTHVFSYMILFIQVVYYIYFHFIFNKQKVLFTQYIYALLSSIILFIPFLSISLLHITRVEKGGFWITKPTIGSLLETLATYSGNYFYYKKYIILILFVILVCISFYNLKHHKQQYFFLFLWMGTNILIPFFTSLFSTPIYHSKYTISSVIPFYVFISVGITLFEKRIYQALLIFAIVLYLIPNLQNYYYVHKKEDWRAASTYISKNMKENELLLIHEANMKEYVFDYYFKRKDVLSLSFEKEINDPILFPMYLSKFDNYKKIYFLFRYDDKNDLIKRFNDFNFSIDKKIKFKFLTLYELKNKNY